MKGEFGRSRFHHRTYHAQLLQAYLPCYCRSLREYADAKARGGYERAHVHAHEGEHDGCAGVSMDADMGAGELHQVCNVEDRDSMSQRMYAKRGIVSI